MSGVRTFRHPIGAAERMLRSLHNRLMRTIGHLPYTTRAQGARFVVDTTDLICRTHPVDYFLDIGANAGVYSIMLAVKGIGADIVAFEPDPGNRARLMENIAANGLEYRIQVIPHAVGDKAGEVTLMEAGEHNRGESWIAHPDKPPEEAAGVATHVVKQIRFDDEFAIAGKIILVKMDVEGSEFHALAGMERTLRDNQCYLQVELYSDRFEELKALFARLGYRYLKTNYIDHYFTNMPDVA
jgi:FkbM family methyltransferase